MKVTIDLPPELLRSATRLSSIKGTSLPELIVRLLRRHLGRVPEKPVAEAHSHDDADWRQELL